MTSESILEAGMTPLEKMKNPIQPLAKDATGVLRFKENALVRALLDHGRATGFGLNELARKFRTSEHADDWQQLAQLIGYSLSGYGELSYVSDDAYGAAEMMADEWPSEKDARIARFIVWAQIETAPKDGTKVLIVNDEGAMDVAGYVERLEERIEFVRNTKDGAVYRTVREETGYWSTDTVCFPTHWMPLPEPPDA